MKYEVHIDFESYIVEVEANNEEDALNMAFAQAVKDYEEGHRPEFWATDAQEVKE